MPRQTARKAAVIAAIAAFSGALAVGYRYNLRDDLFARNFGIVEAGTIYRSGRQTPGMMHRLVDANHIRTIVDLGAFAEGSDDELAAAHTALALGVERFVFRLNGDGTGDPNMYAAALKVITDPAKAPVLVHCSAGAQRTSGCVVLYRTLVQGRALDDVYPESFNFKHDPARNPWLLEYLHQWVGPIGESLRSGETIPYTPPPARDWHER